MSDFSAVRVFFSRYGEFAALLGGLSLVLFFLTLVAIPLIIVSISADYFIRDPGSLADRRHPVLRAAVFVIKNSLGAVFLLAGFIMLFIPGQGLLTIMIGLMLMNFPGKRRLELKLIRNPRIREAVNWIRVKAKRSSLELPE
ncbi:PGPGW domain-containing protein [Marispirochaeta aestuarii]|uniref:PGPGW domain-containing protein n=1 Tax=Marispirochaeta aestuarii TaxID=1963862 RepID=UPI002ABE647E|nr:PGPGW domain-containing protein [Marispirochaeta aestuarii]